MKLDSLQALLSCWDLAVYADEIQADERGSIFQNREAWLGLEFHAQILEFGPNNSFLYSFFWLSECIGLCLLEIERVGIVFWWYTCCMCLGLGLHCAGVVHAWAAQCVLDRVLVVQQLVWKIEMGIKVERGALMEDFCSPFSALGPSRAPLHRQNGIPPHLRAHCHCGNSFRYCLLLLPSWFCMSPVCRCKGQTEQDLTTLSVFFLQRTKSGSRGIAVVTDTETNRSVCSRHCYHTIGCRKSFSPLVSTLLCHQAGNLKSLSTSKCFSFGWICTRHTFNCSNSKFTVCLQCGWWVKFGVSSAEANASQAMFSVLPRIWGVLLSSLLLFRSRSE